MTKTSIRFPDALMKRIKRTKPEHLSANAWIVELLDSALPTFAGEKEGKRVR